MRNVSELAEEVEKEIKSRKKANRGFSFECVRALKMLTDANIGLVAEARKLRKEDAQAVKNLNWDEKTELMLSALDEMPDEHKKAFLGRVADRIRAIEGRLAAQDKLLPAPEDAEFEEVPGQ